MGKVGEIEIERDFLEKLLMAANHITRPFDLHFGEKLWIVIGYDPQDPMVKITYHQGIGPDQTVSDLLNDPSWPT